MKKSIISLMTASLFVSPSWALAQGQGLTTALSQSQARSPIQTQERQLPDSQVPHVYIKDKGAHVQGRVLVSIHTHEKYDGLTFKWCPPVNGVVDCEKTYSYLGCRKPGNIYTMQELAHAHQVLSAEGTISSVADLVIATGVVIAGVYASGASKAAKAAEASAKGISGIPAAKEIGTTVIHDLGPTLVALRDRLTLIAGLSALGFSFSGIVGRFTRYLDPVQFFNGASLTSWDTYNRANLKQVDIARNLDESVDRLNTILCHIDGE